MSSSGKAWAMRSGRPVCPAPATGACGFIGSHTVERLVKKGYNVKAFTFYNSRGSNGWIDNLDKKIIKEINIISGDIRDQDFLINNSKKVDAILHLAALIGIPYSYHAPKSYIETNVIGTYNVLNASKINNMPFQTHALLKERRSETSRITRKKKTISSFCARETEFTSIKTWLSEDNVPNHLHIHGETGMGKSWLVAHFYLHCTEHHTQQEQRPKPIIVRCRPEQKQNCLHPIVELLHLRFQLCNLNLFRLLMLSLLSDYYQFRDLHLNLY